jgi:hypothetical protein
MPLSLGGIPELQDPVAVIGSVHNPYLCMYVRVYSILRRFFFLTTYRYPTGGDNISVSVGVVSRVEPQQYTHGATSLREYSCVVSECVHLCPHAKHACMC